MSEKEKWVKPSHPYHSDIRDVPSPSEVEKLVEGGFKSRDFSEPKPLSRSSETRAEIREREKRAFLSGRRPEEQVWIYEHTGVPPPPPKGRPPSIPPPPPPPELKLNFTVTMKCAGDAEPKVTHVLHPVPGDTVTAKENYAKREALKAMTRMKKKCEVIDVESESV